MTPEKLKPNVCPLSSGSAAVLFIPHRLDSLADIIHGMIKTAHKSGMQIMYKTDREAL